MSQSELMSNALGRHIEGRFMKYEPILNLYDNNNSAYDNGWLNFDSVNLTNLIIDPNNGYIEVPITVEAALAFTADLTYIALKNGIQNLVSEFQLKINDKDIERADFLPFYNSFLAHSLADSDWAETNGFLHHYSKDTRSTNNALLITKDGPLATDAVIDYNDKVTDDVSTGYNNGFADRIKILHLERDSGVPTKISFIAHIPLKSFSSFFRNLDTPLQNCRINLRVKISGIGGDYTFPFMRQTAGELTMKITPGKQSRLVVYKCEFPPHLQQEWNNKIASGNFTKKVVFWSTKHYKNTQDKESDDQNFVITPGISNPKRILCAFTNMANWKDQTSTSPATTDVDDKLKDGVNIEINNQRLYPQDLDSDYLLYKNLQRELLAGEDDTSNGAILTYKNFKEGLYRYYIFNIADSEYILKDPNASVQLRFLGKKTTAVGGVKSEMHFWVEYEVVCLLDFVTPTNTMRSGD